MPSVEPSIVGRSPLRKSEGENASDAESLRPTQSQKLRPSTTSTVKSQHPFEEHEKLRSCVRLLDARKFASLPRPLPRAQDLPEEFFGVPCIGDEVISVSHAWRNQAHPDPMCRKTELLAQLLSEINTDTNFPSTTVTGSEPRVFLFLDFISIPQKPFRAEQKPRTPVEAKQFRAALECMHEMFYYSDHIIHLAWENTSVPGEGVERSVPAEELRNFVFSQIGDAVQISGHQAMPTGPGNRIASSARGPHVFDQVVSVDDQPVNTTTQVENLLATGAMTVTLRSYPFGMSSNIPADSRGWVFLERFISMVKCAMMDKETAQKIIRSPCEATFQQIMDGANRLREAAMRDLRSRKNDELKQVLESYTAELHCKQFTPASTDKWELRKESKDGLSEDQALVHSIMQTFVAHLATHWEAEAAKQRSFANRFNAAVAAAEDFLLEWDCFSEDYAARLAKASSQRNPWPVALLVCLPFTYTMVVLLLPYAHLGEGWRNQTAFWAGATAMLGFWGAITFPVFLAHVTGVSCSPKVYLRCSVWALGSTAVTVMGSAGLVIATDVFPVPMFQLLVTTVGSPFLLCLWWCIPVEQRASSQFRKRLVGALGAVSFVILVMGMGMTLLNAAIPHISVGWQMLLVLLYLAVKLAFEALGRVLSRQLGADAMPSFVYWAACSYQFILCVAFSRVSSWLIVAEQIGFDVLENIYHIWSIRSRRNTARREQYIVASLVLREFVEIIVPLQFLAMQALVKRVRPEFSNLLCGRSGEEVRHAETILQVDISVELLVSSLTYVFLVQRGHAPLRMIRGLVATRLAPLMAMAGLGFLFYGCAQHSHWGMDLSFRFAWLFEADAVWECGLTWTVPG